MNVRRISMAEAREMFPRLPLGTPAPSEQASPFVARVGSDARDAVLERCHADPTYQRWVLACLQVRLSIQADQTFRHPPDRRAEITRIMVAAHQRRAQILENQPV